MKQRLALFVPLGVFLLLSVLFFRGLFLDPNAMPSELVGREAPSFDLPDLLAPEQRVTEAVLKGEVTLLNVWATWCPPCRVEHPYLVDLAESGIPIVGVNYKDDTDAARDWLRDLGDPYIRTVIDASGRLGIDLGLTGAPETYLVDANGIIHYRHIGIVDDEVWEQTLKPLYESLQ
ncbi:DsbE family thiol:disulfide interchange protein [Marinimicrobium alkaliphilum]|uniref:DsbE family thiol:disulfide interchange protein n=1 Tax=Marinimicrobium alkaliphilum TaxID=2202654 RepID=UPI000DBAC2FA|nr:DsbE family thiol:disulfide interchange protein [Marinimicrobium alkaliphilum]